MLKTIVRGLEKVYGAHAPRITDPFQVTLAPDSNALRVLLRLGYGEESKNYATTYRSAVKATSGELPDAIFARRAHIVLRRHGQEVFERSAPRCDVCPIRANCGFYLRMS